MVGASYLSFEKSVPRPRTAALEGYNSWLKGAGTTPRTALFSSAAIASGCSSIAVKAQSYQQPTLALSTDLSATSRLSSIHPRACEMLYVAELDLGTIRAIARLTEESVPIILK